MEGKVRWLESDSDAQSLGYSKSPWKTTRALSVPLHVPGKGSRARGNVRVFSRAEPAGTRPR